jgi:hypothetical protein
MVSQGSEAMAYRLSDYVTYGELYTTSHYGVYGFLVLRTEEEEAGGDHTIVRLELTGDPDPDLQDKHICFEPEEGSEIKYFRRAEHRGLQMQQYGATGTMTAQGWVRALPCSPEEYLTRARLGEPPPTEWKNHLYLEWYGPNGRTLIELAGAIVEICTREADQDDAEDSGEWEPLPNLVPKPAPYVHGANDTGDIEFTAISASGAIETCTGTEFTCGEATEFNRVLDGDEVWNSETYIDDDDDDDDAAVMAETRLMDECLENGQETPLARLLGGIDDLPAADDLDEDAAEVQLKVLLSRLALVGVALSVCKHCTPRDAYRLLVEKILPDEGAFEELIGTGWVQHFMTSEYCAACDAEADDAYERAVLN